MRNKYILFFSCWISDFSSCCYCYCHCYCYGCVCMNASCFFHSFRCFFFICLVLSYACVCSRYMTMCLCTINRVHCCALTQSALVEFIQSPGNPVSIYTRKFCVPFAALSSVVAVAVTVVMRCTMMERCINVTMQPKYTQRRRYCSR